MADLTSGMLEDLLYGYTACYWIEVIERTGVVSDLFWPVCLYDYCGADVWPGSYSAYFHEGKLVSERLFLW